MSYLFSSSSADDRESAASCLSTIRGKSRAGIMAELDKMQADVNASLEKTAKVSGLSQETLCFCRVA